MAEYIGLGADDPTEDSERKVAAAFRRLPNGWVVLHHISWQSKRGGRQGDGEADFIVFHPKKGMIVVEVKGGGIEIDRGRWISTDRFGGRHEIKNPFEQATTSKHALIGWLAERGLDSRIRVGHAVAFPHMDTLPYLGPAGQKAIALTKPDLATVDQAITRCLAHWSLDGSLSAKDVQKTVEMLAPTISAAPTLSSASADAEANLVIFTAEQIEAFSRLRSHRGGLVTGGAGTGKTVLAVARAQQLAKDGFRTLLVCYNELLGSELTKRLSDSPNIKACTFHSLCLHEARRARLPIPASKPPVWWENDAPNLLVDACSLNETTYDAIVVDEGQDFSPVWLDALRCLTKGSADPPFFVFADPLQDIWKRDWDRTGDYAFTWQLSRNMRNTQPIALRVASAVGTTCDGRGIPGPAPIWKTCDGPAKEKDVVAAVEHLLDEGFGPTNLVVLCGPVALASRLRERSIGAFSFGTWGSRGIPVETINRFKGLESQAIVFVIDGSPGSDDPTAAYVGMSRARSILVVVGSDTAQPGLNWGTK